MSKSDLKARTIYQRKGDSIHAHLGVVFAAMAVGHGLEQASGMSLKRVVRPLRKYRTFEWVVAGQRIQATSTVPDDVRKILRRLGVSAEA